VPFARPVSPPDLVVPVSPVVLGVAFSTVSTARRTVQDDGLHRGCTERLDDAEYAGRTATAHVRGLP